MKLLGIATALFTAAIIGVSSIAANAGASNLNPFVSRDDATRASGAATPDGAASLAGSAGSSYAKAAALPIVGAWVVGDTMFDSSGVIVFLDNGYYYLIENVDGSDPSERDGFERGTYTWNPASGAFAVTTLQDLDGEAGLNSVAGAIVTISGDKLTFAYGGDRQTLTRVTAPSPIVGAWLLGDASVANGSAMFVMLANGTYYFAQDGDSTPSTGDPTGKDGIEHGTYAWNPATGALTTSRSPAPYVDTNGEWGLSHVDFPITVTVAADRLTATVKSGPDTFSLPRVGPAGSTTTAPNTVVEYFYPGFGHYFITALPAEIAALDSGTFPGWIRTGQTFGILPLGTGGAANVCRFFSTAFAPKSSHFYTPFASECEAVKGNTSWQFEAEVFAMRLPDTGGNCAAGTIPLYRIYNNGQTGAPNHRYTTDIQIREQMVKRGFIAEGYGPIGVIGCVPF